MYVDFHTHILPGIDDGAADLNTAINMLELAYKCGAEVAMLTPHIASDGKIDEFLKQRDENVADLKNAINKSHGVFPELMVGAEVKLNSALSDLDDVKPLCIEGTELLLLELPYAPWASWYNNEIYNLISKHNITPVMAHIERYLRSPKDIEKLSTLISFDVKFQINASSFLTFSGRRIIRELAAEGLIDAIGSDCHNLITRSPDISRALKAFEKKFGDGFMDHIYHKTISLIDTREIK